MKIHIDRRNKTPVYLQIAGAITEMIRDNRLTRGYKLPSERKLAEELGVHRNTVVKAYGELIAAGRIIASRQRPKGYFVESSSGEEDFGRRFFPLEQAIHYEFNSAEKQFTDIFWASDQPGLISFGGIIMDKKFDPVTGLDDVLQNIFRVGEDGEIRAYLDETEHLKQNICQILRGRDIYVQPRQVQIVAETNQAISYLLSLYLREGDCIVAEEPVVPDNGNVIRNRGVNVITVPMEPDGMDLAALETAIRQYKPKFIYTTPNFHNPTGIVMSLEKRQRLLHIASDYNIPIIEEDYQREFRYDAPELPSLYVLDRKRSVVYLDSFTLTFPYGVKIGYVVGPTDLIRTTGRLLENDEVLLGNIGQYLLNAYIDRGGYARHVKLAAAHYREKRDLLCRELDRIRDKGITYLTPAGGVLLWCQLAEGLSAREIYQEAKARGVLVMPGGVFYRHGGADNHHIRLCFSNVTDEEIKRGVQLLGEALDACGKKRKGR